MQMFVLVIAQPTHDAGQYSLSLMQCVNVALAHTSTKL